MTQRQALKLFEDHKVRTVWEDQTEEWYFSVVDVIAVLTDSITRRTTSRRCASVMSNSVCS